jgi:hypothetical protein
VFNPSVNQALSIWNLFKWHVTTIIMKHGTINLRVMKPISVGDNFQVYVVINLYDLKHGIA